MKPHEMNLAFASFAGTIGLLFCASVARAEETYFRMPLDRLQITAGEWPKTPGPDSLSSADRGLATAYSTIDDDGEVFLTNAEDVRPGRPTGNAALCIRVPRNRDVTGTLYVPTGSGMRLTIVKFTVPSAAADLQHRKSFYEAQRGHYQRSVDRQIPGGAWFRYRVWQADAELAGKSTAEFEPQTRQRNFRTSDNGFEDTVNLFSGGCAVSENLQLNRFLPTSGPTEATVDLSSLAGISVAEMDWRSLTKDISPETDPLAAIIPSDQHVLFVPSFQALMRILDEAEHDATPVLQLIQSRSEDAHTFERYTKQLCLEVSALSKLLAGEIIAGMAVTGSDPDLPTGSDVAILFEPKQAAALKAHIAAQQAAAAKADSRCLPAKGSVGASNYTGVVSPDRTICSYLAEVKDTIVVTNSLRQLQKIVQTSSGSSESLASLPEYRFFRNRYRRSKEETGLLIITDKTIRRWCSPKWRIGSSRRIRAAAILAHYQAKFMNSLVAGTVKPQAIETLLRVPDLGIMRLTNGGVRSSTYGSLGFLTPIAELEFTKITKSEADLYERWREGYQRNWSQFFDPIAVQFSIRDERLSADLTVMPLIDSTEYREFIEIVSGTKLKSTSGDPHPGSLLHIAMAVNPQSERLKWASNFLEGPVKVNLLSWLGDSVSLYADRGPFWSDLAAAMTANGAATSAEDRVSKFLEENYYRVPIALTAEVKDSLKLTLFLSGIRAFIEQTAPGLVSWTSLTHHGLPYVKITATESGRNSIPFASKLAIYYAAMPDIFMLTLNEDVLKHALDRRQPGPKPDPSITKKADANKSTTIEPSKVANASRPWLGESLALQVDAQVIALLEEVFGQREYQTRMQARAWSNIPILNEWKKMFPAKDPVAVQRTFWLASPLCPGGGKYIWNKDFQTMESTVYGHPGEPRLGPTLSSKLMKIRWLDFGLTFENRGLRAKAMLSRGK